MGLILDLLRYVFKILRLLLTGNVRGLVTFLLGLALLGALWEFTLMNLSSQATATGIMTQAGAEVINPFLESHSFGLSQTAYAQIEQQAAAHPDQTFSAPGINVSVRGSDIAGKSFDQGTLVYYRAVADAYYTGGASAVFSSPAIIGQIESLPLLPQGQSIAGATSLVPGLPLLAGMGLSINLLTASGHAQVQSFALWFGIASLVLLGLLVLLSKRWARLSSPGISLIGASLLPMLGIGVAWFIITNHAAQFAPYSALLGLLSGTVLPTYVAAFVVGVLAVAAALVGRVVFKTAEVGVDIARHAVPAGAAITREVGGRGSGGAQYPGSGYPGSGYSQGGGSGYRPEYQRPQAPSPAPYADQWPAMPTSPSPEYPPAAPAWPTPASPQAPQSPQSPQPPDGDPFGPTTPYGQSPTRGGSYQPYNTPPNAPYGSTTPYGQRPQAPRAPGAQENQYRPDAWRSTDNWPPDRR